MTLYEAVQAVEKADPVHGKVIAIGILTGACEVFMTKDEQNRVLKLLLEYADKEAA